jgi:Amt family ammonium transporter
MTCVTNMGGTMIHTPFVRAASIGTALLAGASSAIATAQEAVQEAVDGVTGSPIAGATVEAAAAVPNPGNNAWMMTSTILVLLMILPGLALFYGGLTRSKNMLSTLTQVGATAALAMLIWVMWGYSTAFGPEGNAFFSWGNAFLTGTTADSTAATFSDEVISEYVFISFQMTFAAITAALILGATAERMKFTAVMVFVPIWLTIVYFPIAHMVWATGGLLFDAGALDFAGGTVVHINAGVSGLVLAMMLGKRRGYPAEPMPPHSLVMTMIGTGLLWVGWFGFNAGSELEADGVAGLAMINTFVATAAGALTWMVIEKLAGHKGSALGFCSGVIAGLVGITPSADAVDALGALFVGFASGAVVAWAVTWKSRLGIDESLDAFAVHGIGGIVGSLCVVLIGFEGAPAGIRGILLGGSWDIVWREVVGIVVVSGYAFVATYVIARVLDRVMGLRAPEEHELEGMDLTQHAESAYDLERT